MSNINKLVYEAISEFADPKNAKVTTTTSEDCEGNKTISTTLSQKKKDGKIVTTTTSISDVKK